MLFTILYNAVFLILIAVCVYYTILYTQLSEDVAEIKLSVKNCNPTTTTESFRSKKKIKKTKTN